LQKDYCHCKINPGDRPGFLPSQNIISKSNLWAKTRAEHGAIQTEEAQTLLSKKIKLLIQNSEARFHIQLRLA
jgi:hypothetical protein